MNNVRIHGTVEALQSLYRGAPDIVLKNKIKNLRADIKSWNISRVDLQRQRKVEILNNLNEWDKKAEDGSLNDIGAETREEWIAELYSIEQQEKDALDHFSLRFKDPVSSNIVFRSQRFNKNFAADSSFLDVEFAIHEIKEAIWSCCGSKAPGPDGLNFNFMKRYWNTFEADFVNSIKHFENCGRLAKVIHKIVSPNQTALIKGRKILDGVLVANEVIDYALNSGYLQSASISVLVNGSTTSEFHMERGHRQGDPLSPLLFNVVSEALQVTIFEACDKGVFKGLGVNLSKRCTYGVGVQHNEVEMFARITSCKAGPAIYLFGSPGGRLTLAKSVLGALPLYYLSLFRAPVKVINELEKIRCRFFWGFKDDQKGIVWISWKNTIASRDLGGLGLGSFRAKNLGLLAKWQWRFLNEKDAVWNKVISSLYGPHGGFNLVGSRLRKGVWQNILNVDGAVDALGISFRHFFKGKVRSGSEIRFRTENWFDDGPCFKEKFPRLFALESNKNFFLQDRWVFLNGRLMKKFHIFQSDKWEWMSHIPPMIRLCVIFVANQQEKTLTIFFIIARRQTVIDEDIFSQIQILSFLWISNWCKRLGFIWSTWVSCPWEVEGGMLYVGSPSRDHFYVLCNMLLNDMSLGNHRWGNLVRDTILSEEVGPTHFSVKEVVPRWHKFPRRQVAGESSDYAKVISTLK
ncbi:hypothetical protein Tco_0883195 [Tanacetum coccineum]